MTTRRTAFLLTLGLPASFAGLPAWAFAGEFWNTKKPEEWSAEEVEILLNKSPWAREVNANLTGVGGLGQIGADRRSGGYGGMGGTVGSGSMGGSRRSGGTRSGDISGSTKPAGGMMKGLVRWERALPIPQ